MGILLDSGDVTLGTGWASSMGTPRDLYQTLHTIAVTSRETEFGSILEPIPITLKNYKPLPNGINGINGYKFQANGVISSLASAPRLVNYGPSTSAAETSPGKDAKDTSKITRAPPKKKWIREYLEEEPAAPVSLRVVPAASPPAPAPAPAEPPAAPAAAPLLDQAQEHSRPRTTSVTSHGPSQIPSPPSVSSSGSASSGSGPRAGTREVHNKLEKNRRAHLKECFELLKRQLPATPDDKKTSNLSILGSAIRYIQVLRRKERECEHEMERLAREKIAAQQRLAALKRDVSARPARLAPTAAHPCAPETIPDDKEMQDARVNGHVLGISTDRSPPPPRSPPLTLNLSTKLRTLPIQITPTTSQTVVRTSYGARHNTLTLSTLACDSSQTNGVMEKGSLGTLVHPAQIHLPISQVVPGGGLVVSPAALQLFSATGVRVLPAHTNGVSTCENNRISRAENGIVSSAPVVTTDGVVPVVGRGGLAPLVVSQPHLLHTHTLTHKMVESRVVKGGVSPLSVSAQYLSTTIVKPVVVVSTAHTT